MTHATVFLGVIGPIVYPCFVFSYNDLSCVPAEPGDIFPIQVPNMNFVQKMFHLVSNEHHPCIAWMPHGRAFRILVPRKLEETALPLYFGHSNYSKLVTCIRTAGFKYITTGIDRGCYYHEVRLTYETPVAVDIRAPTDYVY